MKDDFFDENGLKQWCQLYVRFVIEDSQRLSQIIQRSNSEVINSYRMKNNRPLINSLLKEQLEDKDYLDAFGWLSELEHRLQKLPSTSSLYYDLINQFIKTTLSDGTCYILANLEEHPILKAIPEKDRFKFDHEMGIRNKLGLRYCWQKMERSQNITMFREDIFDSIDSSQKELKIALSPFANQDDMKWAHDSNDKCGIDSKIPFWCVDANNEKELSNRIDNVLELAKEEGVHVLLFPELVMTESTQVRISTWLKNNAFDRPSSSILLVIAGTRHVFANGKNQYSNRCTVFNKIGDLQWEQEKCESFDLTAEQTQAFFQTKGIAFEPTQLSKQFLVCRTALGRIATPICLDFLCENTWKKIPVDVFFVPAMSPNLIRFEYASKGAGKKWGSAVFVCNTQSKQLNENQNSVYTYLPRKSDLQPKEETPHLFIVNVAIDMK
jgi:hypothetical protein